MEGRIEGEDHIQIEGFTIVGKWKTWDKYQCDACNFDTLEPAIAMNHFNVVHAPPPPPKPRPRVPIYDRFNNLIGEKEG